MPWRSTGAGVCLAAGGQDEASAKGFGPPRLYQGPTPAQQRPLQGLILAPLAPLLMACAPLPARANQLRMAADEGSRPAGPSLCAATN